MNKKYLFIILGVIVLLLIGGGVFFMSNKKFTNKVQGTSTESITSAVTQENNQTVQQTLKQLLASGLPQKCTYLDNTGSANVQGTAYISGGKIRGDFSSTVDGKTTSGHTVFDGKTSYIWTDGMTNGYKVNVDPTKVNTNEAVNQGIDLNKSNSYSCSVWIPDQSLFITPANITFSDIATPTVTVSGLPTGTGSNSDICKACDSLSGTSKTQCLTALKCQ